MTPLAVNNHIPIAQVAADSANTVELLSTASGPAMLAIVLIALGARKLVLPRELDYRDQQMAELKASHAKQLQACEDRATEFKRLAFSALRVGEKVASVAEERGT